MARPLTTDRAALAARSVDLAWWVVHRYRRAVLELGEDEAISTAMLAVVRAAEAFDPEHGAKWSTYAVVCCRRRLCDAVERVVARRRLARVKSLDHSAGAWDLPAPAETTPAGPADVAPLLAVLRPREREVVDAVFGLNGPARTMTDVGATEGVTRSAVSNVYRAALRRMRKECRRG